MSTLDKSMASYGDSFCRRRGKVHVFRTQALKLLNSSSCVEILYDDADLVHRGQVSLTCFCVTKT
jgi:hypothetical protein